MRIRSTAMMMLGVLGLAVSAVAQESSADTASAPAAPAAERAVPSGPIVIAPEPRPAPMEKLTGGHLVFLEGMLIYSRWKETVPYYDWYSGAHSTTEYQYTDRIMAMVASYSYLFPNGLSAGGSVGFMSLSSSSKIVSGQPSYYYGEPHSSSASINLIGPRIGYYFTTLPGKVVPFAAFEYDIISGSYGFSQSMMRIGGGMLVRVAPSAAISVGIDYVDISDFEKSTNIMGLVGMNFIFK
jgi:hypothetical protein